MLVYDPPSGSYTSSIPSGTQAFRLVVAGHYQFRTEVVRDQSRCQHTPSEHCECRAIDFFVQAPGGRPLFDWAVANADPLGIQSVIHDRRVWGFGKWYERAYTGPSPHTDHVHIGLTIWASKNLTQAFVRKYLPGGDPFMALTDEEQKELLEAARAIRDVKNGIRLDERLDGIDRALRKLQEDVDALKP